MFMLEQELNPQPENTPPSKPEIMLSPVIKVTDLAELLHQPVTEVIRYLLKNGVLVTLNDNLDFETAAIVADDFGYKAVLGEEVGVDLDSALDDTAGELVTRAPVVTMMGHVDHGKTSLLDYIRKTKVAEKESGGITQHMGAYQVESKGCKITFLDTPGHQAFGAIRAQGTKVTDIVILVVAADDGVKPQTVEAIDLAKAAGVPIIVAMTKIDRPEANVEKVKQELGQHNILTESWGGKIPLVGVSAKTGEGVDELLELICLTAEVTDLKAPLHGRARGVVIEAQQDAKVGQLATILVQSGTLKVGDIFVTGGTHGKIRSMIDYASRRVTVAGPSMPVRVTGFIDAPAVGDLLVVMPDEKSARQLSASRKVAANRRLAAKTDIVTLKEEMKTKPGGKLSIVVKADVQGSLQAIVDQLNNIKTNRDNGINIVSSGVGNINESDVLAAQGENGFVVGFKVDVLPGATKMAAKDGIRILSYEIIYNLTDDLGKLLIDVSGTEHKETIMATGWVLKVFMSTAKRKIVGIKIEKGETKKEHIARFYRGEDKIGDGKIKEIKMVAEEVDVASRGDFGFMVEIGAKLKENDRVEFIKAEDIPAELI
ncbi:MAG: Translation initiation factor IF-2 [candidate division Kazan bacterium GW2011_GWA1_44_22]|uniref:Translation initiation factor IF-2 n=1 Tax=candidate division Kazan bacterium GW2011_GWA1_44_22 TaxID=1620410 RepID=A0A0G1KX64_UNCK3|nr:MAG: Translation initiation factor IF-2 [candidate division Kazan bacterium GW2011_GWA1_44_22]